MAKTAVDNTANAIIEHIPPAIPKIIEKPTVGTSDVETPHSEVIEERTFEINFREAKWEIHVEATNDENENEWLILNDIPPVEDKIRKLDIRVCLAHPFSVQFGIADSNSIELLMRMGAAIATAEVLANYNGVEDAHTVRRNLNDLLLTVFANP